MRVVIIRNIITPYEIARFNAINKLLNNSLLVLFKNWSEVGRNWKLDLSSIEFSYKILPDIPIRIGRRDIFTLHTNFTTFSELKKASPHVVISCGWDSLSSYLAYFYCKRYNKKFVLWSGSTINERSWRRTISKPLVKYLVKNSNAYIAYGTRAKEYLIHLGAEKEKIFIGWNTVDNSFFERKSDIPAPEKKALKSKLGIQNNIVITYVGRFIPGKGLHNLIKAFSYFKKDGYNISLLLVGDGPEEERLKMMCVSNNINGVVFTGFIDYIDIPIFFAITDIFIFPSVIDIWGLVINEAMACGLPIITTDKVGASVDLVKDGINGFVVGDNSTEELYNSMKKMVDNNSMREKMATSSREIIRKFNLEHTAIGVLDSILYATNS